MFQEQIKQFFIDFFAEGWRIVTDDLVNNMINSLPNLVGYVAIACGGYMIIAPMLNRNITHPAGIFVATGIMAVSILGAT